MTVYIIIGTTEDVYQEKIGENFIPHYNKSVVAGFKSFELAQKYIELKKLNKPIKQSYSGTKYYKGGYYEMEIESVEVED